MPLNGMEMQTGMVPPKAESEHFQAAKFLAGKFCVAKRHTAGLNQFLL